MKIPISKKMKGGGGGGGAGGVGGVGVGGKDTALTPKNGGAGTNPGSPQGISGSCPQSDLNSPARFQRSCASR